MASLRTRAYQALGSERRVEILRALERAADGLGVDAIAQQVGLHVNTVREHLDRLVACGFVTRAPEQRTTRGRPRIVFRAADDLDEALSTSPARDHLVRILVQGYGQPMSVATDAAEEAGRVWARARAAEDDVDGSDEAALAHQIAVLHEHLAELGFEPATTEDGLGVRVQRCPLQDLARDQPEVVCGIHHGVVRGILDGHPGPAVAGTFVPGGPDQVCTLRLEVGCIES